MPEPDQQDRAQEFTISLPGQLPPEALGRIHRADHRAVLSEIAEIDLAPRSGIRFLRLDDELVAGGRTQGIAAGIAQP